MSIGLAIALVGLTSLGLALLLVPLLLRPGRPASRDAYNLSVYRDQLGEVERDLARGLLNPQAAEAARAEIGRRILALGPGDGDGPGGRAPLVAAVVAILLLPVAALGLYAQLGSPSLPDRPFAGRGDGASRAAGGNAGHPDMQEALGKLRAHLKERPDDLTGWLLLGRSEMGLGHFAEAADAYRRAVELSGRRADIAGDWGEAQVMAAGGSVTPDAQQAFKAALDDPESAPRARYYLALARLQQGDAKGALDGWVALAAGSPEDAEWLPLLRQRIAEAAKAAGVDPGSLTAMRGAGPPAAAAAAAPAKPEAKPGAGGMPSQEAVAAAAQATAGAAADERRAMIDAMVERLAARLEQQPDDAEGWARLGRSYMVLQEPAKAREAYARAVRLKPDDAALKEALAEAATAAAAEAGRPGAPPRR